LTPAARRWRVPFHAALSWREWDGEFVVRDERSGSTHLLDARAGSVFSCLVAASAGAGVAEIAVHVLDPTDSTDPAPAIEAVLIELERIGLAVAEPA